MEKMLLLLKFLFWIDEIMLKCCNVEDKMLMV